MSKTTTNRTADRQPRATRAAQRNALSAVPVVNRQWPRVRSAEQCMG